MKLTVLNEGLHPVRVIIDHDTVHDSEIAPGDEAELDAPGGIIELRELDMGEGEDEGTDADAA
jgi:hypothetical protein